MFKSFIPRKAFTPPIYNERSAPVNISTIEPCPCGDKRLVRRYNGVKFRCCTCYLYFTSAADMRHHVIQYNERHIISCVFCDKEFFACKDIKTHNKCNPCREKEPEFQCFSCGTFLNVIQPEDDSKPSLKRKTSIDDDVNEVKKIKRSVDGNERDHSSQNVEMEARK